jgi:hypothetical protein
MQPHTPKENKKTKNPATALNPNFHLFNDGHPLTWMVWQLFPLPQVLDLHGQRVQMLSIPMKII